MKYEWRTYTVQELIDAGMLEEPMDGNHGSIHPKTSDYVSEGVPFIMANNLVNGRVDYNNCAFITEGQASTLKKGFSKPGDVLLTHKATIGRTAIVTDEYDTIILTPQVTYYRIKSGISNTYLKCYFDSPGFQQLLSNWAGSGSTRAYLGITAQRKLPIVLPPIEVQLKIAAVVETIDKKIYNNEAINKNLEEQAEALFRKTLQESNTLTYSKLELLADVKGGKRLPKGVNLVTTPNSHPYIRVRDLNSVIYASLSSDFEYVDDETQKLISRYTTSTGDVLMSIVGTIGLTAIVDKTLNNANLTENCVKLTSLRQVSPEYLLLFLRSDAGKQAITKGTVGAVQPKLPIKNIQSIPVPVLDKEEICRLDAILSVLFKQISSNVIENKSLVDIRDSLLPKLMSGEIDVSNVSL